MIAFSFLSVVPFCNYRVNTLNNSIWDSVWPSIWNSFENSFRDAINNSISNSVWPVDSDVVRDSVWRIVRNSISVHLSDYTDHFTHDYFE